MKNILFQHCGIYEKWDEIDFKKLPNQFVIKCTHDSGGLAICKNKATFDFAKAKKKIEKSLKTNYYWSSREWPYKNVKPRIIIEKFMSNEDGSDLQDYKIHCFNGEPKIILVCKDRYKDSGLTEDFFDLEWNHIDIKRPNHENSKEQIPRPKELEEMIELSKRLSKDIPFVRTDFYTIQNKVYFGEITFFPASGLVDFEPKKWDKELGNWLELKK